MPAQTVLQIAQAAADVIGLAPVGSLVNNSDPASKAMVVLLNRGGRTLAAMRNAWGQGWTILTREYEFQTTPDVDQYALPEDFEALIDGTVWDRSTYRESRGTLSPQEWQQARSGLIQTVSIAPLYRIRRSTAGTSRALFLEPTPTTRDSLVLEYVSNAWMVSGTDSAQHLTMIAADTDVPLFNDRLMELDLSWRFKQSRGLTFAAELAEFEQERDRTFAEDAGPRTVSIGRRAFRGRWPNIAETGFGPA